jgi:hypothetical protein
LFDPLANRNRRFSRQKSSRRRRCHRRIAAMANAIDVDTPDSEARQATLRPDGSRSDSLSRAMREGPTPALRGYRDASEYGRQV